MTTRYIVHQANMIADDFEWHLHRADCLENTGPKYDFDDLNFIIEADNAKDALADWLDEEMIEMGWTDEAVKVFPCTAPYDDEDAGTTRAILYPLER